MRPEFWTDRWLEGRIGFHRTEAEPFLTQHWAELGFRECERVFVPLCGKSVDLLWLRDRGHHVAAIELSEIAVESFFAENGVLARRRVRCGFDHYQGHRLELLRGNFFELAENHLHEVSAVYDRAALISWAPELRTQYVEHLTAITPRDASIVLITIEHPQKHGTGPPFSLAFDDVHRLYSAAYDIREHARRDVSASELKLSVGVPESTFEVCYHLVPKS